MQNKKNPTYPPAAFLSFFHLSNFTFQKGNKLSNPEQSQSFLQRKHCYKHTVQLPDNSYKLSRLQKYIGPLAPENIVHHSLLPQFTMPLIHFFPLYRFQNMLVITIQVPCLFLVYCV